MIGPLLNPEGTPGDRLSIVVTLAGAGQRFSEAGFDLPKPLIPVCGEPMYSWSVASLPLAAAHELVFVLLKTMPGYIELANDIQRRFERYRPTVVSVEQVTGGQAETAMRGLDVATGDGPLVIHNADTAFVSRLDWAHEWCTAGVEGGWLVFESSLPRWSFIRLDDTGRAVEVAEKQPISGLASTGTYYFRRAAIFKRLVEAPIRAGAAATHLAERYVAPLYQDLIDEGGLVVATPVEQAFCFGTPADLREAEPAFARHLSFRSA